MPRATGEISTLKLGPFIREPTSSALHVYSRLPHGSTAHIQQKGISTQWRERAAAPHSTIIARKWCRHLGSLLVGSRGWQSVCLALEGFDVHVAALLGLSGAGVRRGGGTATARLDRGRRTLPSRTRWPESNVTRQSRSACHRSGPNTSYWMSRGETPRSTNALHFDDSDDRITSWSREHADDDVSITSVPPAMLGDDLDANVDVWVANTLMNESDAELRQSDSYAQALRDLNRPSWPKECGCGTSKRCTKQTPERWREANAPIRDAIKRDDDAGLGAIQARADDARSSADGQQWIDRDSAAKAWTLLAQWIDAERVFKERGGSWEDVENN